MRFHGVRVKRRRLSAGIGFREYLAVRCYCQIIHPYLVTGRRGFPVAVFNDAVLRSTRQDDQGLFSGVSRIRNGLPVFPWVELSSDTPVFRQRRSGLGQRSPAVSGCCVVFRVARGPASRSPCYVRASSISGIPRYAVRSSSPAAFPARPACRPYPPPAGPDAPYCLRRPPP